MRRLLVHQLLLTEKRGLPLSRLLRLRRTEAKSQGQGRREEEESASPILKRRSGMVRGDKRVEIKEVREGLEDTREVVEDTREVVEDTREVVEETKEEGRGCSKDAVSGDYIL